MNKSPPPRAKVQSLTDRRLISLLLPAPCSGGRRHFWVGWSWGGKTSGRPLQGQRGNRAWFCSTRVLAAIGALLKLARAKYNCVSQLHVYCLLPMRHSLSLSGVLTIISITMHTVPAQKSNISKKLIVGKSLTFSFLKIIRRLLLFVRLSYYFTPVLGSQSLPRSSRLRFWPAGFILPPIIENLLIYFFQYGPFVGGVATE